MSAKDPPIARFQPDPIPLNVEAGLIELTPELEEALARPGKFLDIPETNMWKTRREWVRREAESFWHNSDPWTALYMAAVTWERFYAST